MDIRFLVTSICTAVLFLAGYFVREYQNRGSSMASYQRQISQYIKKSEASALEFLNDSVLINTLTAPSRSAATKDIDQPVLQKLMDQPYSFCLYKNGHLVFWSNQSQVPQKPVFNEAGKKKAVKLSNGTFYAESYSIPGKSGNQWICNVLIPIKLEYFPANIHFKNQFPASVKIPETVRISLQPTSFPVLNEKEEPILYLQGFGGQKVVFPLYSFLLFLMAFLSLALTVHHVARITIKRWSVIAGIAVLIVGIVVFRLLISTSGLIDQFNDIVLLEKADMTGNRDHSLGSILANILMLFWFLLFMYRQFKRGAFQPMSLFGRIALASANHFSILIAMVMFSGVCKALLTESGIPFDFDSVFNMQVSSFLAFVGIILFMLVFFMVSHRMTLTIKLLGLTQNQRFVSIGAAFIVVSPFFYQSETGFSLPLLYLAGLAYILLFEFFVESNKPSIAWLLIWIVLFSGLTSTLLFKYSKDRDLATRETIAKSLLHTEDTLLFKKTSDITVQIAQDARLKSILLSCTERSDAEAELLKSIQNHIDQNNYISDAYLVQVRLDRYVDQKFDELVKGGRDLKFTTVFKDSTYTGVVRKLQDKPHHYAYKATYDLYDSEKSANVWISYSRRNVSQQTEFSSLLNVSSFKNIPLLDAYDYSIYKGTVLQESKGSHFSRSIPLPFLRNIDPVSEVIYNSRSHLIYRSNDYLVAVSKPLSGLMKPISLFSYLFGLLVLTVFILAFVNTYFKVLPDQLRLEINRKLSLRNKIQLAVLVLIMFSFIIVGIVTVFYFSNTSEQNDKERLQNKALSVQFDAQNKVQSVPLDQIQPEILSELVPALSKIHQTDISIFGQDGQLIHSTDIEIFQNKFLAGYMNPLAFQTLRRGNQALYINDQEAMGNLIYKAAFVPIRYTGNRIVAYVSLPYSNKFSDQKSNVKSFMGTLLNVYVFLLMIAGGIAIAVSNSITRPITVLGDKLKAFKLGRSNERLDWKNNDELGELIKEYNKMVEQLDRSAELLAQNEREVAWREMAKQVAHEIKNPLTPMKLSIQHLQLKINDLSLDDMKPLISRVSTTLIEQIDNLNRIASEFSNFSKLPEPDNEKIILNDLIASVHDLFRKREDIIFNLYVPIDEIYIFADRSHMLRILNNLIKNALQSIPEDRKGKINIKLYTKNGYAIIQVSDNGTGIPKSMQDKVFYPNFTTKSSGTGLGLAISKDISEAYGGRIYFTTIENKGTDFYFEMPLFMNS